MRRISYPYFCLQNTINDGWGIKLSTTKRENKMFFFLHMVVCFDGREQSKVSTRSTLWQVDECGEKLEASATNDRLLLSIHILLWQARLLCFASDLAQKLTRSAHKWTGVGKVLSKLSCWLFLTRKEGREQCDGAREVWWGSLGGWALCGCGLLSILGGVLICYGISLLSTDGPSAWGGGWIKVSGKEGGGGKACLIPRKRRRKESSHNVDSQEKGIELMLIQVPLLPLYVGEWNRYGGLGGLLRFPIIIPLLGCCTHTHCCSAIALALLASGRCPISEIDSPFNSSAAGLLHIFAETERFYCQDQKVFTCCQNNSWLSVI